MYTTYIVVGIRTTFPNEGALCVRPCTNYCRVVTPRRRRVRRVVGFRFASVFLVLASVSVSITRLAIPIEKPGTTATVDDDDDNDNNISGRRPPFFGSQYFRPRKPICRLTSKTNSSDMTKKNVFFFTRQFGRPIFPHWLLSIPPATVLVVCPRIVHGPSYTNG